MHDAQRHTITSHDGLALNVWDHGGSGRPLLLWHCTGTHGRVWDPVVALLRDSYRLITPDTRGQGDSERPPTEAGFAWSRSGRDALRIIDALNLPERLSAVGHSAGGAHLGYAALHRPGSLGRVMLIDPIIVAPHTFQGEHPLAALVKKRVNDFESLEDARARFVSKPPMSTWTPETVDAYVAHAFVPAPSGGVTLKCPGTVEAVFYNQGGAAEVYDAFGDLDFDLKLVTADGSNVRVFAEALQEKRPGTPLDVFEGASHFIPQERPEEIAALIREWFPRD